MESENNAKYTLWKQSSMAPEREYEEIDDLDGEHEDVINIDPGLKLMYLVNGGDLDSIKELLESGVDVNFRDIDHRTALHVAACQGYVEVAELLLENGAKADSTDRWGSTPLADAIHYNNDDVINLLEKYDAKNVRAPMQVENAREVPDYEINPIELDFTDSVPLTKDNAPLYLVDYMLDLHGAEVVEIDLHKGTFRIALWSGTTVAVKAFWEGIAAEDKVTAFRDELALLQKVRHPNVVQFLGAVTQSSPMMIVTEYLPKGDLHEYLKNKGPLKPATALRFAMDIARGMNYLHENRPEAIIHRDLESSNILLDDSGHLKVADFGVSKLLKVAGNGIKEDAPLSSQDASRRYVAPEVFRNEEYDTKVDVFSFGLILQEMIEGCQPFFWMEEQEVPKFLAQKERPPFKASSKFYAHGLRNLIEECWSDKAADRPTFKEIIPRLESIYNRFGRRMRWKVMKPLKCFIKNNTDWL